MACSAARNVESTALIRPTWVTRILCRDRDHREMLDRVDLRLDQQGDEEPEHVGDQEPGHPQDRLARQRRASLAPSEPQPLIDRVEHPLDRLDHPREDLHHQPEQARQKVRDQRSPGPGERVDRHLLQVPAGPGGQHQAGRQEDQAARREGPGSARRKSGGTPRPRPPARAGGTPLARGSRRSGCRRPAGPTPGRAATSARRRSGRGAGRRAGST